MKNISQIGSFPQVEVKIKNIWNHHLVEHPVFIGDFYGHTWHLSQEYPLEIHFPMEPWKSPGQSRKLNVVPFPSLPGTM